MPDARVILLGLVLVLGATLSGCGQRGPLYLPDRNARVVTRTASSAPTSAPASAPASSPTAIP